MLHLVASLLARLTDLLVPSAERPDTIAIPVRRDDRRGPHRDVRRR